MVKFAVLCVDENALFIVASHEVQFKCIRKGQATRRCPIRLCCLKRSLKIDVKTTKRLGYSIGKGLIGLLGCDFFSLTVLLEFNFVAFTILTGLELFDLSRKAQPKHFN